MPITPYFRMPALVDPSENLGRVLSNLQGQVSNYEAQKLSEQKQADLLKQQAVENERQKELLGLRRAEDARAQEQLADTQALAARRAFTESKIAPILQVASTDRGKARQMLEEASSMGGFTPNVQEQKILSDLLAEPTVTPKEVTGTVTITSPDGKRTTNYPLANVQNMLDKGWILGKEDKESKGTGKGYSPKELRDKYTKLTERVAGYGSKLPLVGAVSDDAEVGVNNIKRLQAIGISPDTIEDALIQIEAEGGDLTFETDEINRYFPPVINPNTGKAIEFGDALEAAEKGGVKITMDDKGNYTLVNVGRKQELLGRKKSDLNHPNKPRLEEIREEYKKLQSIPGSSRKNRRLKELEDEFNKLKWDDQLYIDR